MNPKLHTTLTMIFWFIVMVILHFAFPIVEKLIVFPITFAGITLVAVAIWLNVLSVKTLLDRDTPNLYATTPRHLVTVGPFSLSRNPIYVSTVALLLGVAIVFGSLSPFIGVLGWWLCLNFWFIPAEEKQLGQVFGVAFEDYKRNVRRWL